jgi:trimeric autotransporter adhesin
LKRANLRRKSSTIPKAALALTEQQHSQSAVTLQGVAAFCFAQRYGVIASPQTILSLLCGEQKRQTSGIMKTNTLSLIISLLIGFALLPNAQAVSPPPDGGYPGANTAEGQHSLFSLTTGGHNTATGYIALYSNTIGFHNTATGASALQNNTRGNYNTADGSGALALNTSGSENTAIGLYALFNNTNGTNNTATGASALINNRTGDENTALGSFALYDNRAGNGNTAIGDGALYRNTGSGNVALGVDAGTNLTNGSNNVCIGEGVPGVAGENNTTRIGNVYTSVASGRAVYVNSDNKIGTLSSSRRYKEEIKAMDKASERLFELKPVTFRYKKEVDPERALSFGLIAEDVVEVSAELITRDEKGNPQTVRYEAVNAMLLNEFLKEHKTVQDQGATIARQQKQIEALTAGLQKVSAQLQVSKSAPQTVLNSH